MSTAKLLDTYTLKHDTHGKVHLPKILNLGDFQYFRVMKKAQYYEHKWEVLSFECINVK